MKINKKLLFVLVLAFMIRAYKLDINPPGVFGDEIDLGYHAYSLFKTGRDTYGQLLPSYVHSFSEWKAPAMMYFTAPFVGIFGLNEYSLRIPSVIAGTTAVFLIYVLALKLYKSQSIALIAAVFMTISPWHIQYSRGAWEANLLLTLTLAGILLSILGMESKTNRTRLWLLTIFVFSITFYTYNTANVFTPLLALGLVYKWKKQIFSDNKQTFLLALSTLVLLTPFTKNLLFGSAGERFSNFAIFTDDAVVREINEKRNISTSPLSKFIYNKPVIMAQKFISNYSSAFSPEFLFQDSDPTLRHSVNGTGEFYWIQLPMILLGLYLLISRPKRKYEWLLFYWLAISVIPSALTKDGNHHTTRLLLALPPLTIIAAYGGGYILKHAKIFLPRFILLSIFIFEIFSYLINYWTIYPRESWRWWHFGFKQAMAAVEKYSPDYDRVFINNTYEPALSRFLFWTQYPPEKFHKEFTTDKPEAEAASNFTGFKLGDKYFFGTTAQNTEGNRAEVMDVVTNKDIYLVSQRDEVAGDWDWRKTPPSNIKVLETITNPFDQPIFYLVTGK